MAPYRVLRVTLPVLAVVLLLAACGSDASSSTEGAAQPTPVAGVPTVSNPTTFTAKPVISPGGNGPRPTKVLTQDLIVGTGTSAKPSDTVDVRYVGALYTDGKEFDSSWGASNSTDPTQFPLSGVVPGFAQGIVGMAPGGRRTIVIPAKLGYGAAGYPPDIPSDADLVFVVDLIKAG